MDRKLYGVHKDITDKDFYTNSNHMAVDADITVTEKMSLEGPFHKLTTGGHICHVFLKDAPLGNEEAWSQIISKARCNDIGYLAINFPINECKDCGFSDPQTEDICLKCNSKNLRRVRRITGYLAPLDVWGDGKLAELEHRIDK
jgi:ribonucleoside-triphosphate reductase